MNVIHDKSCEKVLLQIQMFRPSLKVETQYRAKCISCGTVDSLTKEEVENWNKLPSEIKVPVLPPMMMNENGEFVEI